MKHLIIILSLTLSLNSSVKKELTFLVSSSDDEFVDTLVIGTREYNEETPNGYYSYSQASSNLGPSFGTFVNRESDYGSYFRLPAENKLKHLKFFAPALYTKNLKVGESVEDIPLPDIDGSVVQRIRDTLTKEEAERYSKMNSEEKVEFIQELGKKYVNKNSSNPNSNKDRLEIIADYRVLDNIYYENPIVNDYVTVIESTSRSPKGEFKSVYYYHNRIGFVYLTFMYKKVKYEVLLNGFSTMLVK